MTDLTERLQRYCSIRTAKPLPQLGDSIHCVHTGTEHEAELRLSDLTAGVSLLETLTQENARLREALGDIMALDTTDVHVGYDWGSGGGNYVYADHIRADEAFAIARKAFGGGDA